nr:PRC-barrel domain-containing protein [Ornithinimicrobium sp. F0845]
MTDADVIDQNGDKVGGVGQIYLDDANGQPAWVSVKSGLFGLRESFAPLGAAEVVNGNIQLPYSKDFIKDSPRIDAENHLDDSQQALLYEYYGVDRSAAPAAGDTADGADRTAAFGSEQVAEDLHDARVDGEDEREAEREDDDRDGQGLPEYADTQASADPAAETGGPVAATAPGGAAAPEAAAIGAAASAAHGAARPEVSDDVARSEDAEGPITAEDAAAAGGDADWAETRQAHYQQTNPAAQADWAAEESPEEPVATDWSVPSTDPADEEPTRVSRSGYSPDRPAAHSGAYEGHTAPAAAAPAGIAADAGTGDLETEGILRDDLATDERGVDDAVTGATHQTGTGYPAAAEETGGPTGGAAAAVTGAAVAGAAAGGIAASDTETTAYEVPGAEQGKPIADTGPGAELAVDTEDPADGATLPADDATLPVDDAILPADDASLPADAATLPAGTDAGVDDTGEPEAYGAQGYHPDRDGTDMTDEERARLNDARGAL